VADLLEMGYTAKKMNCHSRRCGLNVAGVSFSVAVTVRSERPQLPRLGLQHRLDGFEVMTGVPFQVGVAVVGPAPCGGLDADQPAADAQDFGVVGGVVVLDGLVAEMSEIPLQRPDRGRLEVDEPQLAVGLDLIPLAWRTMQGLSRPGPVSKLPRSCRSPYCSTDRSSPDRDRAWRGSDKIRFTADSSALKDGRAPW
jgi:hypothetical protein